MICYECKNLNLCKNVTPCSECIRRPHDICCSDKFDPVDDYVSRADKWIEQTYDGHDTEKYVFTREDMKHAFNDGSQY